MQSLTNSHNSSAMLFDKLILLDFDCKTTKTAIDENTFNTKKSCIKAFEAVTYFLFNLLDKTKSKNLFKDIWPIKSVKDSLIYRTRVFTWLTELRPNTSLERIPLRKSHIIDCRGENVSKIVMALTTIIMQNKNIKKKQDKVPCKDVKKDVLTKENKPTVDGSKKDQVGLILSKKRPHDDSTSLTPQTQYKKQKVKPCSYSRSFTSCTIDEVTTHQVYDSEVNRDRQEHDISQEESSEEIVLTEEQILTLKHWEEECEREERTNRELLVESPVAQLISRQRRLMQAQVKLESIRRERLQIECAEKERTEQERKEKEKAELEKAEQERIEKKRSEEEKQKKRERQKRKMAKQKSEKRKFVVAGL
ncbi:hypothetical protein INT48_006624 [Thamnidium elegans]|uniref:HAUS augmin-like complex subunit 6 N-terminal domain-containing protein n=1 Tax=Thamnidium elegans TaxID=101142 RepID=A0A8H7SVP1_9FUNG|nr:hypothetical protein INT48_006624 [Thamnidium elegans]